MFSSSNHIPRSVLVTGLLLLLNACAPPIKVAVEERTVLTVRQQSEKIGGQLIRIVQSGDTLYSIAFESNLDANDIAAWNRINDTHRLQVGQRVRLTPPIGFVAKPAVESQAARSAPPRKSKSTQAVTSEPSLVTGQGSAPKTAAEHRVPKPLASNKPALEVAAPKNRVVKKTGSPNSANNVAGVNWSWPVNGKVVRRFSPSSSQQGVDILAKPSVAVVTSAAGEVVYVGNSLKGYGNLVIIKHNDIFLSAYAHNQKILVVEGQQLSSQQIIGAVGINNRREPALHFQIRRKGKPVDPLNYLADQSR